jgi:ornithine cyclodeaminase
LPHLSSADIHRLVPYSAAVADLERAFARISEYSQHPRQQVDVGDGAALLTMPAYGPEGLGVKLLTLNPQNPARGIPMINGAYILFAAQTLTAEATVDGATLTALRTAAVSAVATRHLARPDAKELVVFGAGAQAAAHILAMQAVRAIEHVTIVGTGSRRTYELRDAVQATGLSCDLGKPDDVAGADIVCTCTTSTTPLFRGEIVSAGTHINAVGTFQTIDRELDGAVFSSAQAVVETRAMALAEAGDVVLAISEGQLSESELIELRDVVCGNFVRDDNKPSTIFKSVGLALEDLVVARTAVQGAALLAKSGVGR